MTVDPQNRVYINTQTQQQELPDGMAALLYDEEMEVEAMIEWLEIDGTPNVCLARPDWSTRRFFSYYHPNVSTQDLKQRYNNGERYFHSIEIPERSDLSNTTFADATFDHSFLSDISFRGADLCNVKFLDCNLKVTDFRDADLEGANFRSSSLEATYFQNANLTDTSFAGAHVMSYELQEGEGPDDQGRF